MPNFIPGGCAQCGKRMYRVNTSLPPGQATCQECRRIARRRAKPAKDEPGTFVRTCPRCDAEFSSIYANKRFCSAKCRRSARQERFTARGVLLTCQRCGIVFHNPCRGQTGASRRFCSKDCLIPTSSSVPWAECTKCGGWFIARMGRRRCSECRRALQSSTMKRGSTVEVTCRDCHVRFACVVVSNVRQFCESCKRKRERDHRRGQRRGGKSYRAKARRLGVFYEPVNVRRVFVRDGWRCGLCGKKVNPKRKAPDPLSASLDHIVPMNTIDKGEHSYRNTQCAHLGCNVAKNRGGVSQLRLVG